MAFHFPRVLTLGTHHFDKELCGSLKCQGLFQDVMCWHDYAESVVISFINQIQY